MSLPDATRSNRVYPPTEPGSREPGVRYSPGNW